jgi:uncharacterized protein DUF5681
MAHDAEMMASPPPAESTARSAAAAAVTASAVPKQLTPWKPGQSGNPKGREKGSRNKLAQRYFEDCYTLWQEGGIAALRTVMHDEPAKFCALIANGVPHQFRVDVDHTFAGLSPQELRDKLVEARARLLEAGMDVGALGDGGEGADADG